ncbi:MAG: AAA family ATPase [bacterium]
MDHSQTNQATEIDKLLEKLKNAPVPSDLKEKAGQQVERARLSLKYGGSLTQIDITSKYIDWISALPWNAKTEDNLDLNKVKTLLDQNHFGLEEIKRRVLEYLSLIAIQKKNLGLDAIKAPSLMFVGLVGTGKTTFAKSVAEALGRKFARIPFGGLSSVLDLRGQAKTASEAEPGAVLKALRRIGTKNPVILLDEIDRIDPTSKAAIMGVLVELLDPEQNAQYIDYFIDYPFDLSQVLFIATANNSNALPIAVLDRLEVVQMPSYTDEEKIMIAKTHLLPKHMKMAGLTTENLKIDEALWTKLTRPMGYDAGVRSLERTIETIIRKVAYKIMTGQGNAFVINEQNLRDFL